jgi:two-component system nitrogen regulation sensor histidine kinase NtrY
LKTALQIAWIIGIFATAILVGKLTSRDAVNSDSELLDVAPFLLELEKESDELFKELSPIGFDQPSHQKAISLRKKRWYILGTERGSLSYWNSNKIGIDTSILTLEHYPALYQYGDDLYAVFKKSLTKYFAFRLANDGKIHPRLTKHSDKFSNKYLLDTELKKEAIGSILPFQTIKRTKHAFLNLALFCSFIFICLTLWYAKIEHIGLYVTSTIVVGINVLTYYCVQLPLNDYFLVAADRISDMSGLQLNVILYIHLISLVALSLSLFSILKKLPKLANALLLTIGILFLADFFLDLNAHIVHRSAIPFDFEKLFNLNSASFSALSFVCISFISLWLLIHHTRLAALIDRGTWLAIVASILVFMIFQYWDANRTLISLSRPVLLVGLCVFILKRHTKPRWTIYTFFVITALLTASIIAENHKERDNEIAQHYAIRLVNNEDPRAEIALQSFENELAQEFLVPEDYHNFIRKKESIESRLKHLYFTNYLEKYELKLLSFSPDGSNINGSSLYTFGYLDSLFNNHTSRTQSAYFYRLDNTSGLNGYIAEYENCDLAGQYGSTYILLQPRVVQSDFLYPEVFKNQEDKPLISLNDYSFGLYFNDQLVSQKGNYSYQLNALPTNEHSLFSISAMHHFSYSIGQYKVVLSKRENTLRAWLSTFTFTLVTLLLIGILSSLAAYFFMGKEHPLTRAFLPFSNRFLSTRIQTSLTIILLTGLLLSVYIIIGFIQANYNQNLEDQLLNKVKSISATLQNKVNLARKLNNEEQRTLILNEESSTYNVDINLYSVNGILLSSTKPYLTDQQILGEQMNPQAFVKLTQDKSSQLLIQEELEGSDYLSAYLPLFDGKNTILGYVNTPFFGKNDELNKQISNLVVNILNIYFLLLLGGVFLAYIISRQISKPLMLIRDKIAKTELRGSNELIVYNRDDEIGLLVKQYNKMVTKLEESANKMAENEREGAWREMAKQVAHEIKNPLTPMKLSVQHLQRSYTNGPSEQLDILFTKTSKLIIEQIESLSAMASEFSNFAQMPEDKFEVFDVSAILQSTKDLFKQSENAEIIVNIKPEIFIYADPEQVKRVFNNLIKNATQAIPDNRKGKIDIDLKTVNNKVKITIKDNGKGIPTENYKKVFVPNFSTKNSGMGLGLAICRKIVESAKGTITFVSKKNIGTTFTITLPRNEKA